MPPDRQLAATHAALSRNPANRAPVEKLTRLIAGVSVTAEYVAVLRTKYWGSAGVRLTVAFLDNPEAELRRRIVGHMNAWQPKANISFVETEVIGDADVRIARDDSAERGGYWSYVGTDILVIDRDQPTMNLESFTMATPESEFKRVVRHEAGHSLGFVHEHMRRELVERIDVAKAVAYFKRTQGWSEAETRAQVLMTIEEAALIGDAHADPDSIMCYQLPASIMKDGGAPILGGHDITPRDFEFAGTLYPPSRSDVESGRASNGHAAVTRRALVFLPHAEPDYVAAVLRAVAEAAQGE